LKWPIHHNVRTNKEMSETLTIKNFGPIKEMSFEFKKINILIGDQGTGKSTVAKILSAIKNTIFLKIFDLPDEETEQFYGHLDSVGIKSYIKKDSILIYEYPDYRFELKEGKVSINKNISLSDSIGYKFNYIVAERNMVHVLADSLYALLEVKAELPKLFLRFGNKYQTSRKSQSEFNYSEILGVKFTHKNNKDYILIPDGTEINLSDASSGIQGCVALLTVADTIMSEVLPSGRSHYLLNKNFRLLVIEEPELNCFPQTQNKLVKHIIENNKISNMDALVSENNDPENPTIDLIEHYEDEVKNQLVITTHSPYILTSLNNLMYAYQVGQDHEQETNVIIDKKYWINPNDVSAYMLLTDGTCEDILDREENLIRAEKIDEVSGFLNEQFDALLNIELVQK
jgi:energy-coupling factor transporter ATP-binding protein EcfA2